MAIDDVQDLSPRVQYTAAAAQTVFDYPFPIFANGDLRVYVDSILQAVDTDYTVQDAGEDNGGTITFLSAMAGGEVVTIYRDIAIERTSDYQQNGPWGSAATNAEFNRIVMMMQQQELNATRSLRMSPLDDSDDDALVLPERDDRAGKFLAFDASGEPSMSSGTGADSGLRTDLASTTSGADGSRLVGFRRVATGAVAMSVYAALAGALITPQQFGAAGDGSTDDSTALQAALNTGSSVFLPPGSQFNFGTGLTYTAYGQAIIGCGGLSRLKYTGSSIAISMAGFDYCKLENVNLWAPSSTTAVYVGNIAHWAKVLGCRISGSSTTSDTTGTRNSGTGVHVEQSFYVQVSGNDICAFATGVLGTNQFNGNFVVENSIRRCIRGVWVRDLTANSDGNSISHNEIEGGEVGDVAAIDIEGASNNTIAENRCEYSPNATAHIIVRGGSGNAVRNELLNNHCVGTAASLSIGDASGSGEVQNTTISGGYYAGAITIGVSASYTKLIVDGRSIAGTATAITNNSTTSRFSIYNDQSFTVGITGGTTSPTASWTYSIAENVVTIEVSQILVTSNSTACTITGLPALIRPSSTQTVLLRVRDNSATAVGLGEISSAGVITLTNSVAGGGAMTNGNQKGLQAQTITYRLP